MNAAGIDTNKFKPGSTRAASSSKAAEAGVPMDTILQAGGWSRQTTFTKFYKKTITTAKPGLSSVVLSESNKKGKSQ